MKTLSIVIAFLALIPVAAQSAVGWQSKDDFFSVAGPELETEDWLSYPVELRLDEREGNGVSYSSTSDERLIVGAPHGASWILGYSRGDGRFASFSRETITFSFAKALSAFGVTLSQGNSSGGTRYEGSSEWELSTNSGASTYFSVANYTMADFSGEAYLGLTELPSFTSLSITRLRSDANIVWNIRDISWVSAVPEPSTAFMAALGVVLLSVKRRPRRAEA